jgi:cell division protein FtsW
MKIARHAKDELGRFLAAGITITIGMYAMVNAMVTTGLAPTTGLPMPFLSYGGTAIVFSAYAVGILLNISMQTHMRPRAAQESAGEPEIRTGELFDE